MSTDSHGIAEVLRQLLRRVSALSDSDIEQIISGTATIELRIKRRKTGGDKAKVRRADVSPEDVVRRLRATRSRDAGLSYLEDTRSTKLELEQIARTVDIPVQRSDTSERLREKIIEATIGFRLRSEAVHGREPVQFPLGDLRSGGDEDPVGA
jgi:hypothetical protein